MLVCVFGQSFLPLLCFLGCGSLCCFTAGRSVPAGMIRNLAIQLRKVCNHPDLLESAFDDSCKYHAIEWLYWFHDPLIFAKICLLS